MKIQPIPMTEGVDLLRDARRISDNALVKARNVVPNRPGTVGTRPTLGWASNFLAGGGVTIYVQNAALLPFSSPASGVVAGTLAGQGSGIWISDAAGNQLFTSAFYAGPAQVVLKRAKFVTFNHQLFCFPGRGTTTIAKVISQDTTVTNGFAVGDFLWSDNTNTFVPDTACVYRSRMVYGNLGPGFENYIVFSDTFKPNVIGTSVLTSNGRALQVGNVDGDRITAMTEVMLTAVGSPAQSALLVLKENSAYLITGEPNQTTDSTPVFGSLIVSKFNDNCGCAAQETIAHSPYGVFWAGPDDVWYYPSGGQVPYRVGTKIRKALQYSPASMRYKWHGVYHDGFYRLAVFSEGQGPMDISTCGDQWWLDLRGGSPGNFEQALWWGPQQFLIPQDLSGNVAQGTTNFVKDESTSPPTLYSFELGWNTYGITGAGLLKLSYAPPGQRDISFDYDTLVSAPTVLAAFGDTSVVPEIITKRYDFGDPMVDKNFEGLEINGAATTSGAIINADVQMDGATTVYSCSHAFPESAFVMDTSPLDSTAMTEQAPSIVLRPPDPTIRIPGKTMQIRIYDTPIASTPFQFVAPAWEFAGVNILFTPRRRRPS